ncbi:MAG: hypothetical protein M3198_10415 [Actinomycetota bacterium]|nr:hypothetical protein [Actinomycetota bacterium]
MSLLKAGVLGESNSGPGIHGVGERAEGVLGEGNPGVRGTSSTGIGVIAEGPTALEVRGRAVFQQSGLVTIPANSDRVTLGVPGVSAIALVFAMVQGDEPDVFVRGVRRGRPPIKLPGGGSTGPTSIEIFLNATTPKDINVAWFVVN